MEEAKREEIAMFRFSVIGSLINGELPFGSLKLKMRELSKQTWRIPHSFRRSIGRGTIEEWLFLYRHYGLDGLKPKPRLDQGRSRSLQADVLEKITHAKRQNPRRPVALICSDLYKRGEIETPFLPLSTIYRHLRAVRSSKDTQKQQQKRFQHRYSNEMWQSDVMYGPFLPHHEGEKPKRTFFFSVLDDASRLILAAGFYPSEKVIHLKTILREAIATYGIPTKLFVDNGKIYKAEDLEVACAKLNCHLIYSTPYYPEGKGKIERFHRTLRDQLLTGLKDIDSLQDLNLALQAWIVDRYNKRPHQGIDGEKPLDRFLRLAHAIRRLPAHLSLEELFYRKKNRTVGKDATFRVNNILYEAPEHLIRKRIDVLFDSDVPERIIIQYQGKSEGICKPIDFLANANIKRQTIDFNKIQNQKENNDDGYAACCIFP